MVQFPYYIISHLKDKILRGYFLFSRFLQLVGSQNIK